MKCQKCGHEIDENSLICMNCGAAIPEADLSEKVKERVEAEKQEPVKTNGASGITAVGAIMIILGIIADIICMILVFAEGYDAFKYVTIGGTIITLIGFALLFIR